jgi:uncharacterized protein (TIGR02001 family)
MRLIKVDNDPEPSLIIENLSSLKLNTFALVLFLCAISLATPKQAFAQITATTGIASDYLWRGISQSNKNIAASVGLDYKTDSGFYLGTWASTLSSGSYELDLYGGYSTEIQGVNYDVGFISYQYPNDNDYFNEVYFSIGQAGFTANLAYTFSSKDNTSASFSQGDLYYSLAYSKELENGVELGATVGRYNFDDTLGDDYKHLNLSASKSDFTLAIDTTTSLASDNDTILSLAWSKTFNF